MTGLDHSAAMLEFARAEAASEGLSLRTLCADMTAFTSVPSFAAAYNPLSSFRLLHSDAEAESHLRCMASALRSGAVCVLDLAFIASAGEPAETTDEAWEMTRGNLTVRGENDAVYVTDAGVMRRLEWGRAAHLRGYTAHAFAERVRACSAIESWHPESSRAGGISEFAVEGHATPPVGGRAMVVLRRT